MTPREYVLETYPNAIPVQVGKLYEIQIPSYDLINRCTITLGKGKNKRCAWKSASRNIN
jgi:hypothetical protein